MQSLILHASKRQSIAFTAPICRASVASTSRTISTSPQLKSLIYAPIRAAHQPFDEGFRTNARRNYWWSSKTTPKPMDEALPQTTVGIEPEADKSLAESAKEVTAASPNTPDAGTIASSASSSSESISSAASTIDPPVESLPVTPLGSAETLPLEALDQTITDFAALASTDYSHLFSWVWPPGLFLRTYSFLTEYIHITSPVLGLMLAFVALRVWMTPMQLRAQRASARFAPFQDEWFAIQEKLKRANEEGDQIKAAMLMKRMMEIKDATDLKPLAPILPGIGMAFLGIGGFIGAGRLAAYHREVVEMGGVGPLANPGGLFGTGLLEDLTTFSPWLLVIMSGMTWLSARRGALDAAKYSKWMARMPWLMTPPAFALGFLAHFSNAQMILATTSIGYNVLQSYLLRVPTIRSALGMQGVKVHTAKEYNFPPLISAYRDTWHDWVESQKTKMREAQEKAIRDRERQAMLLGGGLGRHGGPGFGVDKSSLRVRDAPGSSAFDSPPAPATRPVLEIEERRANKGTLFDAGESSTGRTLPLDATGPPKPAGKTQPGKPKSGKAKKVKS